MMWSSRFWRRTATAMMVLGVTALMMTGCSSFGPEASTEVGSGDISGTVMTPRGAGIPEIEVTFYADFDGTEYDTQTSTAGVFDVSDLMLGTKHAFTETYEVWVNRTRESSAPIDQDFGTYYGTVDVAKDQTVTVSFVLQRVDNGPEDPEQIVDGS